LGQSRQAHCQKTGAQNERLQELHNAFRLNFST
jgi:hypothetical protein